MPRIRVVRVEATQDPEKLVCMAARGDYMKSPPWQVSFDEVMKPIEGVTLKDKVRNLIEKLMLAHHWGPFEHPVITLGIENMSRVTLAQLTRHRLATFDIQSGRYVRMDYENLAIPPSFLAEEVVSRKGGRRTIEMPAEDRILLYTKAFQAAYEAYRTFVQAGVPVEDARYVLPHAQMVHGHMTANARSLMHVIALRSFGDAQWEIRDLAEQLLAVAKEWMPTTFGLFEERIMKRRDVIAP